MKCRKLTGWGLAIVAMIVLTQCKSKKDAASNSDSNSNTTTEVVPADTIPKVIVDPGFVNPDANGRFTIQSLSLTHDVLTLVVNYSGGCKEHKFELFSSGNYAKSVPPQLNLFLKHTDNEDHCRKLVVDTLRFDVTPTRYDGQQEVVLRFNNTKQTLRYQYQN